MAPYDTIISRGIAEILGGSTISVASLQNPENVPKLERHIVSGIVDVERATIFFRT